MLALALITLELETCCPDWLALTIDLLRKAQVAVTLTPSGYEKGGTQDTAVSASFEFRTLVTIGGALV